MDLQPPIETEPLPAFPGVKFSVTSESFSMGNAVRVHWTLGPTSEEVEKISGKYQQGSFDGMEDMYNYDHSPFSDAVSRVLGQSKYVSESRSEGEGHAVIARALCEYYKLPIPDDGSFWNISIPNGSGDSTHRGDDVGCLARQVLFAQSYPAGAIVTGLERTDCTCGHLREFFRVTFTTPSGSGGGGSDGDKTKPGAREIPLEVVNDATPANGATVSENEQKNGVEIRFPSVPPVEVRAALKARGFRWSRFGGCWYHRRDAESLAFARAFANGSNASESGEVSPAASAPPPPPATVADVSAFVCECGGETTVESETRVFHSCRRPSQSYGMDNTPVPYVRIPKAAGGYVWIVDWQSTPRTANVAASAS